MSKNKAVLCQLDTGKGLPTPYPSPSEYSTLRGRLQSLNQKNANLHEIRAALQADSELSPLGMGDDGCKESLTYSAPDSNSQNAYLLSGKSRSSSVPSAQVSVWIDPSVHVHPLRYLEMRPYPPIDPYALAVLSHLAESEAGA